MQTRFQYFGALIMGGLLLLDASCSTGGLQKDEQLDHSTVVRKEILPAVEADLRLGLKPVKSPKVKEFCEGIAKRFFVRGRLKDVKPLVEIFSSSVFGKRSFALAEGKIYLSLSMLKTIRYENELAALLAMKVAYLENQTIVNKLSSQRGKGKNGVVDHFRFSEEENEKAVERAVGLLYMEGYDPRGLIQVFREFQKNSEESNFSKDALEVLIQKTHSNIVQYTPLRNPVVRSAEFIGILKELKKI